MRHFFLCLFVIAIAPCSFGQQVYDPAADLGIVPLDTIDVHGISVSVNDPPRRYVSHKNLGVMAHQKLKIQRIHAWPAPFNGSFHPRAVITPKNDYLVVFSAGRAHMWNTNTEITKVTKKPNDLVMYRSPDQGETWHGPFLPFRVPYGHNTSVPFVPEGSDRIYLFSTEMKPKWASWPDGGIAMRHSEDDGRTWSKPELIEPVNDPDYRGHAHIQMTEANDGSWLLGTYHVDTLTRPEGRKDRQYILRSKDQGQTWRLLPGQEPNGWYIPKYNYMIEGRVLALDGPNVLLWARAPGGHPWKARSTDHGKTWSDFEPVEQITHPDAPPMIWKMTPDGEKLISLIHNSYDPEDPKHDHNARTELWFSVSEDYGRSWTEPRFLMANISKQNQSKGKIRSPGISYCDMLIDGDEIHVFVDFQFRQVLHVEFKEEDLQDFPTREEVRELTSGKDG